MAFSGQRIEQGTSEARETCQWHVSVPACVWRPCRAASEVLTVMPADWWPLPWLPIGAFPRNRLTSSAAGGASAISSSPAPKRIRLPELAASTCAKHVKSRDPAKQPYITDSMLYRFSSWMSSLDTCRSCKNSGVSAWMVLDRNTLVEVGIMGRQEMPKPRPHLVPAFR